jgi:hypothetical protein
VPSGARRPGRKKIEDRTVFCNQWQWWVISPNSTKLGFGGVPLEALHENHGVGGLLHLFSGVDPRWSCWSWVCLAEKIWSGAVFLIWSCVELSQTRPYLAYPRECEKFGPKNHVSGAS